MMESPFSIPEKESSVIFLSGNVFVFAKSMGGHAFNLQRRGMYTNDLWKVLSRVPTTKLLLENGTL